MCSNQPSTANSLDGHGHLPSRAGLVNIWGAVLIWGVMPFVVRFAAQGMPPAQVVACRLLLASLLLTGLVGPRQLYTAVKQNLKLFVLLATVGFSLPLLLDVYALKSVPVSVFTFISNSYPAFSILLAGIFLGERPTRRHLLGMTSSLIGLYLLAGISDFQGALSAGILLAFLSSLCWATAPILGKKIAARLSPMSIVAGRHVLGGMFAVPLMLVGEIRPAGAMAWLAIGVLALMSVLSFYLYYRGLAKTSVSTAALIEACIPVLSLGIGVALFREGLSGIQSLGAGLILLGTILVSVQ